MVTPDGRRIMTAWMQTPETKHATPYGAKWFGQLTFPRELTERDGRLIQNPIRELEACRKDPVFYQDVCIGDRTRLPGVSGRSVDLTVRVKPGGSALYRKFTVKVAEDEELFTSITYDPVESILYFDRSYSGFMHYILSERKAHVRCRGGEITLRFLVDKFSVEVFVNDGEQTMSNTIYTRQSADGISFEAAGGTAVIDVEKYTIEL
jgi:beta-fructofuranosidase